MNDKRRDEIRSAIANLKIKVKPPGKIAEVVQAIALDEQDAFDNLPEPLQLAERGTDMEENVTDLEAVVAELRSAEPDIEAAISDLKRVIDR